MRRALQPSRILARGTVLRGLLLRRERSLGALLDVWDPEEESPERDREHGGAALMCTPRRVCGLNLATKLKQQGGVVIW